MDLEVKVQAHDYIVVLNKGKPNEKAENDIIYNECIDTWQARWDQSQKGRWTYQLLPNIRKRLKTPMWCGHFHMKYMTGHGDFAGKLHGFSLKESPVCECGTGHETSEHNIYECPLYENERERLQMKVEMAGHIWPCSPNILTTRKTLFEEMGRMAVKLSEIKQEKMRRNVILS